MIARTKRGLSPGVLVVVGTLGMIACGGSPWGVSGAPKAPPDEQFRTGVEVGDDVYLWHCYEGARVVVWQTSSACFGSRSPEIAKGACGARLAIEERWANDPDGGHRGGGGMPAEMRWPGSAP